MIEKRFLQGFAAAFVTLGLLLVGLDLLLVRVGEIDLSRVVDRQLAAPNGHVFFSSGINQHAYAYKIMLFDREAPEIVAIGSSRSMGYPAEFFRERFLTLGGATSNVTELASVIGYVSSAPHPPKLAIVVVDPWWFNDRYAGNRAGFEGRQIPDVVSADLLVAALRSFYQGNWLSRAVRSSNLGIYAILKNEGFSRDGSYRNDGTISGQNPSTDIGFEHTYGRIVSDRDRFEKGAHASPELVRRGCDAINALRTKVGHVVVVAPPFARPVWKRMMEDNYGYIAEAYTALRTCTPGIPFFNYVDQADIVGSNDCEFIDGLHPGDITNARMLQQIADADPETRNHVDTAFLRDFLKRYAGHAAGISLRGNPGMREVDFLKLGCVKR